MDSRHVRMSPSKDVFVSLKHTSEQFQFNLLEAGTSVGDLICVVGEAQ